MQNTNNFLKKMAIPYVVWLVLFIVLPLILVFYYSINTNTGETFTFENYIKFFTSSAYLKTFGRSFWLAFISTILTLIIGYPAAYILSRMKGKKRNLFLLLTIIPMWTNMLLRTYAWKYIIGNSGIINTLIKGMNSFLPFNLPTLNIMNTPTAVTIGMVYSYLPFMILPIFSVLVKLDKDLLHAAYDLGASKLKAFLKVTLPLSVPGIVSGITMVFLPAATTFIVPAYLGGTELYIGQIIERQFKEANNWNFGSALSIILIAIIFAFIKLSSRFSNEKDKGESLW